MDGGIASSAVTVYSGGTLQGTGLTGAVTTQSGGTYPSRLAHRHDVQRGSTGATSTGSAGIAGGQPATVFALSAADAVFREVSGSVATGSETHPISDAVVADGHPAFIYSATATTTTAACFRTSAKRSCSRTRPPK